MSLIPTIFALGNGPRSLAGLRRNLNRPVTDVHEDLQALHRLGIVSTQHSKWSLEVSLPEAISRLIGQERVDLHQEPHSCQSEHHMKGDI